MKEIDAEGKILVLSDIHYPFCNLEEINKIVKMEKPQLLILLGDIVTRKEDDEDEFFSLLNFPRDRVVYVKGDGDKGNTDAEIVRIKNLRITLLHGHQFLGERHQYRFAKLLKKIHRNLPPFLFCQVARIYLHTSDFLVLGHSHALVKFPDCVNAGTLTLSHNLYNDRGYVVIEGDKNKRKIKLKRL